MDDDLLCHETLEKVMEVKKKPDGTLTFPRRPGEMDPGIETSPAALYPRAIACSAPIQMALIPSRTRL
jgi:hypothetical protein